MVAFPLPSPIKIYLVHPKAINYKTDEVFCQHNIMFAMLSYHSMICFRQTLLILGVCSFTAQQSWKWALLLSSFKDKEPKAQKN